MGKLPCILTGTAEHAWRPSWEKTIIFNNLHGGSREGHSLSAQAGGNLRVGQVQVTNFCLNRSRSPCTLKNWWWARAKIPWLSFQITGSSRYVRVLSCFSVSSTLFTLFTAWAVRFCGFGKLPTFKVHSKLTRFYRIVGLNSVEIMRFLSHIAFGSSLPFF